ncbi:hypothetical protein ACLOJK_006605, partial [Asimina triloba]
MQEAKGEEMRERERSCDASNREERMRESRLGTKMPRERRGEGKREGRERSCLRRRPGRELRVVDRGESYVGRGWERWQY